MKKMRILFAVMAAAVILPACSGRTAAEDAEPNAHDGMSDESEGEEMQEQKLLGGMPPENALEYMKNTPNLVIVQVNTAEWKITPGFAGALWIPHDEIAERYDEIPEGRPVLLHCGGGIVSVPAYETLIEKRPDIPELGYIAGSPHSIIREYNEWLEVQ
ncbi:MAG: hypothetical protein NC400_08340 [Clostridium sp.]|nr:hypothetical protein [Clostridium sp.]